MSSATKTKKQSVPPLTNCITFNEKTRRMYLAVLKDESGRELANQARYAGQTFDWKKHNTEFAANYDKCTIKELQDFASKLYGLNTVEEVRERRTLQQSAIRQRVEAAQGIGSSPSRQTTPEPETDEELEEDLEELEEDLPDLE